MCKYNFFLFVGHTPCSKNGYSSYGSCENFVNFVHYVKKLTSQSKEKRYALVSIFFFKHFCEKKLASKLLYFIFYYK